MKGNLDRLLKCLQGYYRLHLGLVLDRHRMPDLVQLARLGDHAEVSNNNSITASYWYEMTLQIDRMIVLVLGCAVTCPDRSCHISRILASDNIKVCVLIIIIIVTHNIHCCQLWFM